MEPVTTIALAKAVASATGLDTWLKDKLGDAVGETAADKIAAVAQVVTDAGTGQEALEMIRQDAGARASVRQKLLDMEHELILAQLQDVQSARQMYSGKNEMADKIAERVISQNHIVVALLLVMECVAFALVNDSSVAMIIGNLIGASVAALWQERQQVIGFFFGSSLGSKLKTALPTPWKKDV